MSFERNYGPPQVPEHSENLALTALSKAIERRVNEAMKDEDDFLNYAESVISARENLRRVRSESSPTRVLDIVAADGAVRDAVRAMIAERLLAVTY